MEWLRLYAEFCSDPKVQSMTEAMQRRLIMLYCLRCHGDLSGLTDEEIALGLRIPLSALEKTKQVFLEKGFIESDWSLPKWEARNTPKDATAAERMRNYRRRQSERNRNVTRNGDRNVLAPARGREERGMGPEGRKEARAPAVTLRNGPPLNPDPEPEPDPEPTPSPTDPAYADVARLATDLGQDYAWGEWVHRMARLGYPAEWIRDVIVKLPDKPRSTAAYATGILQSYRRQGGPDRRGAEGGEGPAGSPDRPDPPARLEPPRIPEGPAGEAFRAMWGLPSGGEQRPVASGQEDPDPIPPPDH